MKAQLRLISLCCLVSVLAAQDAHAQMPAAGKVYEGPKKFSSAELGLAFTLPKGVVGGLDGEFFALFEAKDQGKTGVVLLWTSKGTMADARAAMSANIPVSAATLRPKSKLRVGKTTLSGTYTVVDGGDLTEATISAQVAHGLIVAVIAGYAPAKKISAIQLAKTLETSVRITKAKAAAQDSGSGEWYRWLVGARLTRFSSGSGYSEKESYTFCPNGTFSRSFGASSSSVNGTGAAAASNSGTWSVSGKDNDGVIVLTFANGSVDRSAVAYRDGKTYWGDTRYFYEADQCR